MYFDVRVQPVCTVHERSGEKTVASSTTTPPKNASAGRLLVLVQQNPPPKYTHFQTHTHTSDESNSPSQTNQLTALIANANMQIYIN